MEGWLRTGWRWVLSALAQRSRPGPVSGHQRVFVGVPITVAVSGLAVGRGSRAHYQDQLTIGRSDDALLDDEARVGAGREHAQEARYMHPSTLPG